MTVIDAAEWASPHPSGGHLTPSPLHGDRLKALRTEADWYQAEPATKIAGDAAQISRYENGRITPSADVIVRLSEVFDVTTDYLLLDDAPEAATAHP